MKKLTAILVCLLLVVSLAVAAAADSAEMALSASSTSVSRGDVIDFSVTIPETANCRSGATAVSFDSSVLEFVSGECTQKGAMLKQFGMTNGILNGVFTYMPSDAPASISGAIFNFKMKVKDDAALGETKIALTNSKITLVDGTNVAVTMGSVELNIVCAHKWNTAVTKEATCTAEGEKTITCEICGESSVEKIAKLAHTEETKVTKEATCTAEGEKTTACKVCGEVISTEKIAKLAHTEETKVTKEATCAAEGEKVTACSVCKEELSKEAIAKLPHTMDEGVVTKEPTTKKEGVKTYTCTVCGATETEAIAKLETPPMGDNTMILPFVLLMVLSAAGVAVTVIGKKRIAG